MGSLFQSNLTNSAHNKNKQATMKAKSMCDCKQLITTEDLYVVHQSVTGKFNPFFFGYKNINPLCQLLTP